MAVPRNATKGRNTFIWRSAIFLRRHEKVRIFLGRVRDCALRMQRRPPAVGSVSNLSNFSCVCINGRLCDVRTNRKRLRNGFSIQI